MATATDYDGAHHDTDEHSISGAVLMYLEQDDELDDFEASGPAVCRQPTRKMPRWYASACSCAMMAIDADPTEWAREPTTRRMGREEMQELRARVIASCTNTTRGRA
jgi:hypothetical protein